MATVQEKACCVEWFSETVSTTQVAMKLQESVQQMHHQDVTLNTAMISSWRHAVY
jgi:hypothetical protein